MLQFIVLGYVPGTSIQLSFTDFLAVILVLSLFIVLYWFYAVRSMRRLAKQTLLSLLAL